ncbi:MAG: serine/threonine-protein kinase, partial [Planctomycetota bacterium]
MNEPNQPSIQHRRKRPLQQVDAICDKFEAKWTSGGKPEIRDYLTEIDAIHRPRLFCELLRIDLEYRSDDQASRREWLMENYPEFQREIDSILTGNTNGTVVHSGHTVVHAGHLEETRPLDISRDSAEEGDLPVVGGMRFGGYELLDEIARGGMGVVFRARQIDANRTVALKMILNGRLAGHQEIERFRTEAEAAAKLDHPNIVPIFDVGQIDDQHYFSMAYVDGPSLKELVRDRTLEHRESAEIVRSLAIAIHYAHGRGVIHRDLKPANVLMDVNNHPRITDFGLSKLLDGNEGLTGTGQLLGTPAYMSPEQASGNMSSVGTLSDVYSLGAILYELITGTVPFQSDSIVEVLSKIRFEEPASPRSLSRDVDFDIETICIKCLDKDPQQRYASAGELAEDLSRYLAGEPVRARPIQRGQKLIRWCRRRPLVASLAASLAASLLIFGGTTTYFAVMSRLRGSMVETERGQADEMLSVAQLAIDQMV